MVHICTTVLPSIVVLGRVKALHGCFRGYISDVIYLAIRVFVSDKGIGTLMTRIKRNGMILIVIRLVLDLQMWVVKSVFGLWRCLSGP